MGNCLSSITAFQGHYLLTKYCLSDTYYITNSTWYYSWYYMVMKTYKNLNAASFAEQVQADTDAIILDVRSPREFQEKHIPGALNIPFTDQESLLALDKTKKYYLHCRIGGRSASSAYLLVNAGFENVFNLDDDIENLHRCFIHQPASHH